MRFPFLPHAFLSFIVVSAFMAGTGQAVELVLSDLDGSSAGNATAANLNAGTTGGTWTVNDRQESVIVADGLNGGFALFADRGAYDFDLSGFGDVSLSGTTISYDTYIARTTGTANEKENYFVVSDSGGDELLRLVLKTDGSAAPLQGRLTHTNSTGNGIDAGNEVILADDLASEGGSSFDPAEMFNISLELSDTTYDLRIDGLLVGVDLPYRNALADFNTISLVGSGVADGVAAGAFFDNISVDVAVPEPASVAIWSLIGLGLVSFGYVRRRKV